MGSGCGAGGRSAVTISPRESETDTTSCSTTTGGRPQEIIDPAARTARIGSIARVIVDPSNGRSMGAVRTGAGFVPVNFDGRLRPGSGGRGPGPGARPLP